MYKTGNNNKKMADIPFLLLHYYGYLVKDPKPFKIKVFQVFTRVHNALNTSTFYIYCDYQKSYRNLHFNQSFILKTGMIFS